MKHRPARVISGVAVGSWLLWSLIIYTARPAAPEGVGRTVFLASMLVAAAACVWACWDLLPRYRNRPWRRVLNVALGGTAFVLILAVGHALGTAISSGS